MKRLRGNKLDTVVFEDSWAAIRTAKNAGFRVAGIYDASMADHWEEIKAMADYAYESWEELTE
jgi:beta-phosphoglucomutase-like phosphatase (HAD superfamily)